MIGNLIKRVKTNLHRRFKSFYHRSKFLQKIGSGLKHIRYLDISIQKRNLINSLKILYKKSLILTKIILRGVVICLKNLVRLLAYLKRETVNWFKSDKVKQGVKSILRNDLVQYVVCFVISLYIRFVYMTSRVQICGTTEKYLNLLQQNKPTIVMTWHGRIFIASSVIEKLVKKISYRNRLVVLSSGHKDGEIASKTMMFFNYKKITGSTINKNTTNDKAKSLAIRSCFELLKELKENKSSVFLAPDGPRGPRYKINSSITDIAHKTQAYLFPVAVSYSRKKQLNSWDQFQIPWPFCKIKVEFLEPLYVKNKTDIDNINQELEVVMNTKLAENDSKLTA